MKRIVEINHNHHRQNFDSALSGIRLSKSKLSTLLFHQHSAFLLSFVVDFHADGFIYISNLNKRHDFYWSWVGSRHCEYSNRQKNAKNLMHSSDSKKRRVDWSKRIKTVCKFLSTMRTLLAWKKKMMLRLCFEFA